MSDWSPQPSDSAVQLAARLLGYSSLDEPVPDDLMEAAADIEEFASLREADARHDMLDVLTAAWHALRSYQHGNSSPDLAEDVANLAEAAIAKAVKP